MALEDGCTLKSITPLLEVTHDPPHPQPHMTAHMQVVQWSAVEGIQITTIWKIMG